MRNWKVKESHKESWNARLARNPLLKSKNLEICEIKAFDFTNCASTCDLTYVPVSINNKKSATELFDTIHDIRRCLSLVQSLPNSGNAPIWHKQETTGLKPRQMALTFLKSVTSEEISISEVYRHRSLNEWTGSLQCFVGGRRRQSGSLGSQIPDFSEPRLNPRCKIFKTNLKSKFLTSYPIPGYPVPDSILTLNHTGDYFKAAINPGVQIGNLALIP